MVIMNLATRLVHLLMYKQNYNPLNKMDVSDLKVYLLNASTMAISFSNLEDTLKILLLIASIGYTAQRWYLMNKEE